MKTIMVILSVLIVAPIWFYLLYCILVRVEASELIPRAFVGPKSAASASMPQNPGEVSKTMLRSRLGEAAQSLVVAASLDSARA